MVPVAVFSCTGILLLRGKEWVEMPRDCGGGCYAGWNIVGSCAGCYSDGSFLFSLWGVCVCVLGPLWEGCGEVVGRLWVGCGEVVGMLLLR